MSWYPSTVLSISSDHSPGISSPLLWLLGDTANFLAIEELDCLWNQTVPQVPPHASHNDLDTNRTQNKGRICQEREGRGQLCVWPPHVKLPNLRDCLAFTSPLLLLTLSCTPSRWNWLTALTFNWLGVILHLKIPFLRSIFPLVYDAVLLFNHLWLLWNYQILDRFWNFINVSKW